MRETKAPRLPRRPAPPRPEAMAAQAGMLDTAGARLPTPVPGPPSVPEPVSCEAEQPLASTDSPWGVLGHASSTFFTPSLSSSSTACSGVHPKVSTVAPGGVPSQRSDPVQSVLVLPELQTPSPSLSTWALEQPLASTV